MLEGVISLTYFSIWYVHCYIDRVQKLIFVWVNFKNINLIIVELL